MARPRIPRRRAVDPDVLGRFIASLGARGAESAVSLIDTFLDHAAEQIASLRRAVQLHEAEDARREAHTLKSNAAVFGAPRSKRCVESSRARRRPTRSTGEPISFPVSRRSSNA